MSIGDFIEKKREKKFQKSQEKIDEQREELKKNLKSGNPELLRKFVSFRSLIVSMLPQFVIGIILGIIEYELIGLSYTVISIAVYTPVMYIYSKSLRNKNGVLLMIPTSNFLDWDRVFVSEEIWDLVTKKTGLTLEEGKINGTPTYWCTEVKYLPNTNIPEEVEIAWAHYNRAKFAMFESVLENATSQLSDLLLEVAKLKKMRRIDAIKEGTIQVDENIDAINSAYRDSPDRLYDKQKIDEEEANAHEKEVYELLRNPDYIKELMAKAEAEAKKNGGNT